LRTYYIYESVSIYAIKDLYKLLGRNNINNYNNFIFYIYIYICLKFDSDKSDRNTKKIQMYTQKIKH